MSTVLSFIEGIEQSPCHGCAAPCCQVVLIPHRVPTTLMEVDYVKYLLNFPSLEMAISTTGEWNVVVHDTCRHFDRVAHRCGVHGSPEQPLTCRYYNEYRCSYRQMFRSPSPSGTYFLNRDNFQAWAGALRFSDDGELVAAPNFEEALRVLGRSDSSILEGSHE